MNDDSQKSHPQQFFQYQFFSEIIAPVSTGGATVELVTVIQMVSANCRWGHPCEAFRPLFVKFVSLQIMKVKFSNKPIFRTGNFLLLDNCLNEYNNLTLKHYLEIFIV